MKSTPSAQQLSRIQKRIVFATLAFVAVLIFSCDKKDAPLPDNLVNFETGSLGFPETETGLQVKLRLTRSVSAAADVQLKMVPSGVEYNTHFTTEPAASSNTITLQIPAGSSEADFTINKPAEALFAGNETIVFTIESATNPVVVGNTSMLTVTFAEIVSEGDEIVINGGGATYPNKVFIDFSGNRQTSVARTAWDLGFYTGDEFRVILNSSTGMMAKALDKTDLSAVNASDTVGLIETMSFNAFSHDALAYIDYPDGDLDRTAIAAISQTAEENKVYIINRGTGAGTPAPARGWKKIKVTRNTLGGYTLQHADIDATTFAEVQVEKGGNHFFNFASFEDGVVDVDPEKNKWDLAWTYFSNSTGTGEDELPYGYQDFIIQNRNVQVAKVMTSGISYENFSESSIDGLDFAGTQNALGADWRAGGGPTSAPAIRTDRFYVIMDGDGNYYKVRFTSLTQNGERGYPSFEYALIKKGS